MGNLHIHDDNGIYLCGATTGRSISFAQLPQVMSVSVDDIDDLCDGCWEIEQAVHKPNFAHSHEPIELERREILGVIPEIDNFTGNPVTSLSLPSHVRGLVSDIVLSVGYAAGMLHQIYPLLFDGKRAPGCNVNEPFGDHSPCTINSSFNALKDGSSKWGRDEQDLANKAYDLATIAREGRNLLGHPTLQWNGDLIPVSKGGRKNRYIRFALFKISNNGITVPLSDEGLIRYAKASDELVRTLQELRKLKCGH